MWQNIEKIKEIINNALIENEKNIEESEQSGYAAKSVRNLRFYKLLNNWDSFFTYYIDSDLANTKIKNKPSTVDQIIIKSISDALRWNLYVFYYNLYIQNPVMGFFEYDKESITYLNHLKFNYFDFCNFMKGDDNNQNSRYTCDLLKKTGSVEPFDPLYSENPLSSDKLTT